MQLDGGYQVLSDQQVHHQLKEPLLPYISAYRLDKSSFFSRKVTAGTDMMVIISVYYGAQLSMLYTNLRGQSGGRLDAVQIQWMIKSTRFENNQRMVLWDENAPVLFCSEVEVMVSFFTMVLPRNMEIDNPKHCKNVYPYVQLNKACGDCIATIIFNLQEAGRSMPVGQEGAGIILANVCASILLRQRFHHVEKEGGALQSDQDHHDRDCNPCIKNENFQNSNNEMKTEDESELHQQVDQDKHADQDPRDCQQFLLGVKSVRASQIIPVRKNYPLLLPHPVQQGHGPQGEKKINEVTGDAGLPIRIITEVGTHTCKVEFIKVISDNDNQPVLALTLTERCTPLTNTDVRRMATVVHIQEGEDNTSGGPSEGIERSAVQLCQVVLGRDDADSESELSYNSMISKVTEIITYSVPAVAMTIAAEMHLSGHVQVGSNIAVRMMEKGAALPKVPWEGDVIDEGRRQQSRKSWISSTKVMKNQYKLPGTAITLFSHDLAQDGSCGREIQDVLEGDPWQEDAQRMLKKLKRKYPKDDSTVVLGLAALTGWWLAKGQWVCTQLYCPSLVWPALYS